MKLSLFMIITLMVLIPGPLHAGVFAWTDVTTGDKIQVYQSSDQGYIDKQCNRATYESSAEEFMLDWTDPDGDGVYHKEDATLICDCIIIAKRSSYNCYVFDSQNPGKNRRGKWNRPLKYTYQW